MKKKVVSLLLVTTMVASLAAGCGDSSSSGDGTEKTGKKVETVDYGVLMMGVLFCSIPTMLVFFVLQKQFAEGITGSVK